MEQEIARQAQPVTPCEGAPAMWTFLPDSKPRLLPWPARPHPARMGAGRTPWLPLLLAVLAALPLLVAPLRACAQQAAKPQIRVEPRIVVRAQSQVALPIEIGPADALPKKGFVSLRGLPPNVALTAGQSIAPGSWTVSVSDLTTLKVDIPAGASGQADILISLIALNGRMLAQARTTLVVEPSAAPPTAPAAPRAAEVPAEPSVPPPGPSATQPPAAEPKAPAPPAPPPGSLSPADKERAERALAQGEQYLARGSIQVARQYFLLAADAGLAVAALRLAATYDPAELARLEATAVVPDRDLARKWYERARDLGAREAEAPLARLTGK